DGFHGEIITGVTWQDGYIIPSREPGLGIEFNEELARAHPWAGDELHLGMAPEEVTP
ncbi:MAG: mandelate racemase/muconate lactonizing enzyme family protein, partial [Pseudomonadota bacterium]